MPDKLYIVSQLPIEVGCVIELNEG